ncbi:MAG: galactose mutarotase [Spirochaetaceae bacterium]|nr:galactose mutarotase [Spirochaetaceae bacterium]
MSIERKGFGSAGGGEETRLFTLKAGPFSAGFSDFGATLVAFEAPAAGGGRDDLVLGFSRAADYEGSDAYLGATVGRFANRIARGAFSLDGKDFRLATNNGPNHLHGGKRGFDKRIWKTEGYEEGGAAALRFELFSPDGEEGYPGDLSVVATYRLDPAGILDLAFEAECGAPTILSLTQHAYWNLRGHDRGGILDHELRLAASRYLPVDETLIPTGELAPVAGGPFDFRTAKRVGRDLAAVGGYDHCFVLDREGGLAGSGAGEAAPALVDFAELRDPESGRRMRVATSLPGVQLYTGNFLSGFLGKGGARYHKHAGLCLETELFPDAPNRPDFPQATLRPGQVWRHATRYSFFV